MFQFQDPYVRTAAEMFSLHNVMSFFANNNINRKVLSLGQHPCFLQLAIHLYNFYCFLRVQVIYVCGLKKLENTKMGNRSKNHPSSHHPKINNVGIAPSRHFQYVNTHVILPKWNHAIYCVSQPVLCYLSGGNIFQSHICHHF